MPFFGRARCEIHDVDEAMLAYNIGGELVTEGVDTSHPVIQSLDEIIHIMSQHRHPPDDLVQEMHRRMEAVRRMLDRRVAYATAMSN